MLCSSATISHPSKPLRIGRVLFPLVAIRTKFVTLSVMAFKAKELKFDLGTSSSTKVEALAVVVSANLAMGVKIFFPQIHYKLVLLGKLLFPTPVDQ